MEAVFIYALKDPITGAIRYIGATTRPHRRSLEHVYCAAKQTNHRACWIRSLLSKNLKPEFELLAQVPKSEWPQHEIDYIAAFRSMGCDLTNATSGGDGNGGYVFTPEDCARISTAKLGKKLSSETRARMSVAKKGKRNSPEHRAAVSAAISGEKHWAFGKKFSPEHCAKKSAAQLGEKNHMFGKIPWNKGMKNGGL